MAQLDGRNQEDRGEDHSAGVAPAGLRFAKGSGPPYACSLDGEHVALEVDTTLFSEHALLRAAYKFTDRCYVFLQKDQERAAVVWAVIAGKVRSADLRALVGEFANELVDQRLRERLGSEFGPIQATIVAQAFAEANLLDPDRDNGDYHADPHGAGQRR